MDQDAKYATPQDEGRQAGSSSQRRDRQETSSASKLFAKRPGEPYLFFVQVEIRNRGKIADPIKVRCMFRSAGGGSSVDSAYMHRNTAGSWCRIFLKQTSWSWAILV